MEHDKTGQIETEHLVCRKKAYLRNIYFQKITQKKVTWWEPNYDNLDFP